MAITTLDGVVAGAQAPVHFMKGPVGTTPLRYPYSFWAAGGLQSAGTYNSTLNGGTYSSTGGIVAGQIPHTDPGAGINSYLCRLAVHVSGGAGGVLYLADRLWDNGGLSVTSTSAQSITSPTWPARDVNGATSGAGVMVGFEVSAQLGATPGSLTLGYTNSAGTSGRTGTVPNGFTNVIGTLGIFSLAAGDQGVQSVQSLTISNSLVSGTINLVAFRVIVGIDVNALGAPTPMPRSLDAIKGCFQRIYNGSVPYLIGMFSASITPLVSGTYQETQG